MGEILLVFKARDFMWKQVNNFVYFFTVVLRGELQGLSKK